MVLTRIDKIGLILTLLLFHILLIMLFVILTSFMPNMSVSKYWYFFCSNEYTIWLCESIKCSVTLELSPSLLIIYKVLLAPEGISRALILANCKRIKCSVPPELSLSLLVEIHDFTKGLSVKSISGKYGVLKSWVYSNWKFSEPESF